MYLYKNNISKKNCDNISHSSTCFDLLNDGGNLLKNDKNMGSINVVVTLGLIKFARKQLLLFLLQCSGTAI